MKTAIVLLVSSLASSAMNAPGARGQVLLNEIEVIPLADVVQQRAPTDYTIYDNTAGPYWVVPAAPRSHVLDDGSFPPGTAPVKCARIGWAVRVFATAPLYQSMPFWTTIHPDGPGCVSGPITESIGNLSHLAPGDWFLSVDTTGWNLVFPNDRWAVEIDFLTSIYPRSPSPNATVLFASGGPTVGANDATVFWLDVDENGSLQCPTEARGPEPSQLGQVYLSLSSASTALLPSICGRVKALYR